MLINEKACQEGGKDRTLFDGKFVAQFLKDTEVRVVCALNEAVKENCHLVKFVNVVSHNIDERFYSIFKEKELSLLRV